MGSLGADGLHPLTHVVEAALEPLRRSPPSFPAVIERASPVPYFGRAERARVASVGLNPSGREFLDADRRPLGEPNRRLATLDSLGLRDWSEASPEEWSEVAEACSRYFKVNPYGWFDSLETIFRRAGRGTFNDGGACHIDLVPWATQKAWSRLRPAERTALLDCGRATFLEMVSAADFEVLLLNGASVVKGFERATETTLHVSDASRWKGWLCWTVLESLGPIGLNRPVTVVGWNWNLQGSHIVAEDREALMAWAAAAIETFRERRE